MALTHLTDYPALLGTGAQNTGTTPSTAVGPAQVVIDTIQLVTPDIDSSKLKVEGFMLALLRHISTNLSVHPDPKSVLDISRAAPYVTTRDSTSVTAERFTITFFTPIAVPNIDPSTI